MPGDPYTVGQLVRMASYSGAIAAPVGGFRDSLGVLIDPATVQLKFRDPLGTLTTFTYPASIVKDAVGLYHYDVDTSAKPGLWTYDWVAPGQTIKSNWFIVLADPAAAVVPLSPLPVTGHVSSLLVDREFRRSRQTPTEAVLVSGIDATLGEVVAVTLTAARVVGIPLNPAIGINLIFEILQGGAGGFALTFNAIFKLTWANTGNTVGKVSTIKAYYNGVNWIQDGAQAPYV